MTHRADLVAKLDINSPLVQQRVALLKQNFMARGDGAETALSKAYKILDLGVTKQAAVLSYMDVFLWLGIIFLICIPFMLMVRGNRGKKVDLGEAMH